MVIKKYRSLIIAFMASCWLASCLTEETEWDEPESSTSSLFVGDDNSERPEGDYNYYNSQSTVSDVINDPAFGAFGRLLFPVDRNVPTSMTLAQVSTSAIYMWYPYIQVEKTIEILNYLHTQSINGQQIFYNIYTPEEIAADRSKADTGIFVFKGNDGIPFAITNAGGDFAYVGAMHDSFPHSLELSKAGYTAFALIYRPDDPYRDLAHAITFIYDNAEALGVSKNNYSLWGGSAGARIAAFLGNKSNLSELTSNRNIPQASAVIMQYTGYSSASEQDSPTYNCVGSNDGIASWRTMQNRLEQLSAMGIPTEFHVYEGLGHGFGIGTGTVAEGWMTDAIKFWESNMFNDESSGILPVYTD